MEIVIIQADGEPTDPMVQADAHNYLEGYIYPNRYSKLSQALNDVTDPIKGKATGDYEFDGHPVLHASAGKGEISVTIFFYRVDDNTSYIIAMGEHLPVHNGRPPRYKISDYGQPDGDFRKGATIEL